MSVVKHSANGVEKYIGMDVHRDSTTVVVLDARGKLLMEVTVKTEASVLLDFLRGLSGTPRRFAHPSRPAAAFATGPQIVLASGTALVRPTRPVVTQFCSGGKSAP
jgi:hypothetical protein